MASYPDDADGAALASLAAHGVDMSQPLLIEFVIAAPDEASAHKSLEALTNAGYKSYIEYDEGEPDEEGMIDPDDEEFGPSWTVFAEVQTIPDYDKVVKIQTDIDRLVRPFDCEIDGWEVALDGDR